MDIRREHGGFTLIEMALVLLLIGVLAAIAIPSYVGFQERALSKQVILDIQHLEDSIQVFKQEYKVYPPDLASVADPGLVDPWGNPYRYLNIENGPKSVTGKARKDKSLVPINSTFDLYSMGPDGKTKAPLTAPVSHDDIIRAADGAFVGPASDY